MVKTTNTKAHDLVGQCAPFKGHNTFGEIINGKRNTMYVVYSYGYHWPMYIYSYNSKQWYRNTSKYSSTTSKQTTILKPHFLTDEDFIDLPLDEMQFMVKEVDNA
tara:strand:- start:213 stop:527 length:315 start_codon:yes stop_codon:yes gene_type:complete